MLKIHKECYSNHPKLVKWKDIQYDALLSTISSISSDYEMKKLNSKLPKRLVNFSVERILNKDIEYILKSQSTTKKSEHLWTGCNDKSPTPATPGVFNLIDLDPDELVQISYDFRGKITAYYTQKSDNEDYEKMKTIEDNESTDSALSKISESDIVIFDPTISNRKLIQTWNIIRAYRYSINERNNSMNSDDSVIPNKKTFILISSLLTWSETEKAYPINDGYKFREYHYSLRKTHESYQPFYLLENEFIDLGEKQSDDLRILIIGVGLIYGPKEHDLTNYAEFSLEDKPELPIFGTGQNFVPVIHGEDLIRLINKIIHRYPENYEYVFAVEPDVLTQYQIVSVISRCINGSQCRILDSKFSLLYSFSEEDTYKMSANLPIEIVYQKTVDFKYNYTFLHSISFLIKRHFSFRREFKPPCLIISGPKCERTVKTIYHLRNILGCQLLTPEIIVNSYLEYLGPKESNLKKRSTVEKSINEYTLLPRGQALIKVLNRAFLQPKVQKCGYILYGFPETYSEAELTQKILKLIQDNDESEFHENRVNTSLKPDYYIILLMTDEQILKDVDNLSDEIGRFSAQLLDQLNFFRTKIGEEEYCAEFLDQNNLFPVMFDIGEYDTELECAQNIYKTLNLKQESAQKQQCEDLTLPVLLNLMKSKESIVTQSFDLPRKNVYPDELFLEIDTRWKDETSNTIDKFQEKSENNSKEIKDDSNRYIDDDRLSIKFSIPAEKITEEPSEKHFETGVITDKVKRPLKGTEANISKYFLKKIKTKVNKNVDDEKNKNTKSIDNFKSTDNMKSNSSHLAPEKYIHVKSDYCPVIEWTIGQMKTLTGVVTGWCQETDLKGTSKETIATSHKVMTSLHGSQQSLSAANFSSLSQELLANRRTVESSIDITSNAILTTLIFKNSDISYYKNLIMFLEKKDGSNSLLVYRKDKHSGQIFLLKDCPRKATTSENILIKSFMGDEKKFNLTIKRGEIVQRAQKCYGEKENKQKTLRVKDTNIKEQDSDKHMQLNAENSMDLNAILLNKFKGEKVDELETHPSSIENSQFQSYKEDCHQTYGRDAPIEGIDKYQNSDSILIKNTSLTHWSAKDRRVRFSVDNDENPKPFEEKYNYFIESHMEELKEKEFLRKHDLCSSGDQCQVNLYKKLKNQENSDIRNKRLEDLLKSDSKRCKILNFNHIKNYIYKFWFHFRNNLPNFSILSSSVMLECEREFIINNLKLTYRRDLNAADKNLYSCLCNKLYVEILESFCIEEELEKGGKMQDREHLLSESSIDLFKFEENRRRIKSSQKPSGLEPIVYTPCKRISSVDSLIDLPSNGRSSNESLLSYWNDE